MPLRIESAPAGAPLFSEASPAEFADAFRLPPEEAARYMSGRERVRISYDWREIWQEEHAYQFTVSRLARADLLSDIRARIEASVAGDVTRRDWMRDVEGMLREAGWWGTKPVVRPDGGAVTTRFDPARLKLIYDVNTRMAYAAGRWERIQAARASHPYLRYVTRADERVRASHRPWHNVTLPVDDPWWSTHYPPNGWRCRCRAVPMRRADYDARSDLATTPPPDEAVQWTNKLTGETLAIPRAIDPGFQYNVGEASARWQGLIDAGRQKVAQYAADIGAAAADSLADLARRDWQEWIEGALSGRGRNRMGWLGVIRPIDLAHMRAAGIDPVSAEIMVRPGIVRGPKATRHENAGTALTPEQWRAAPELFARAVALLLDVNSGKLLWLTAGAPRLAQLAMEVDFVTAKPKRQTNALVSAYAVDRATLRERIANGTVAVLWGGIE
jgi:SPP1 gp7 family putative phage head morphogenesis protein